MCESQDDESRSAVRRRRETYAAQIDLSAVFEQNANAIVKAVHARDQQRCIEYQGETPTNVQQREKKSKSAKKKQRRPGEPAERREPRRWPFTRAASVKLALIRVGATAQQRAHRVHVTALHQTTTRTQPHIINARNRKR